MSAASKAQQFVGSNLDLIHSIRPGDKVTALFPAGMAIKNGKAVHEFKERTGKVNPLLIFPDHVVIDLGGRYGTPGVVTAENILRVRKAAA